MAELKGLKDDEFIQVMGEAFKQIAGKPETMKKCLNKVAKIRKQDLYEVGKASGGEAKKNLGGSDGEGNHLPRPPNFRIYTKPAWEVSF